MHVNWKWRNYFSIYAVTRNHCTNIYQHYTITHSIPTYCTSIIFIFKCDLILNAISFTLFLIHFNKISILMYYLFKVYKFQFTLDSYYIYRLYSKVNGSFFLVISDFSIFPIKTSLQNFNVVIYVYIWNLSSSPPIVKNT